MIAAVACCVGRRVGVAALLIVAATAVPRVAFAAGAAPSAATPVQREQAQSRFLKGRELYNAGKHDLAIGELQASLDIVASPNTRLYIARALRAQGRIVAAYVELGRAAAEAKELVGDDPRYDKTAAAALEERAQLAPKLGFVDVDVKHAAPTTTLKVAGDEVRRGGWSEPIPVLPGEAEVLVETPGHTAITTTVRVAGGEHKSVGIDAGADTPAQTDVDASSATAASTSSPTRGSLRPVAYAVGGVALVGLITFVAAGAMANGTHADLEKACGAGPCPPGHESEIASGRSQQTVANVGLAIFAIGAAAGVTLFVLGAPRSASGASPGAVAFGRREAGPCARVTAGPSFVGLAGAF